MSKNTELVSGVGVMCLQFGTRGTLEQHGFARNKMWVIDDDPPLLPSTDSNDKSFIDLLLKSSEEDLRTWPHRYAFHYHLFRFCM